MGYNDVRKDVWASTIPKAFVNNHKVSKYASLFAPDNEREHSYSKISKKVYKVENDAEYLRPAIHLFEGI